MPRPRKPARLWFDEGRQSWCILDGSRKIRTRCSREDTEGAERALNDYLAEQHRPPASGKIAAEVLIADVLLAYATEHKAKTLDTERTKRSNLRFLAQWAGTKTVADVTAQACRDYAEGRPKTSARRELETLSAAIRHWHKEHGPLDSVPSVTLPDKPGRRERYLTRSEAAALLAGALGWDKEGKRHKDKILRHVARFIIIGLYTGTRHRAILALHWEEQPHAGWVDLKHRVLHRRGGEEIETKKRRPKIRIGNRLFAHLKRWREMDRRLSTQPRTVVHHDGQPYLDKLRKPWASACELSGIHVSPHVLRHTRATWMMQRGDDPWRVAGFLGMSLKVLLDTYGHHHPDWQKDVAD